MITPRPAPSEQTTRELRPVSEYASGVSTLSSQAVTWEKICGFLRQRAGAAFATDRDDEADLLRDLAETWKPRTAEARAQQAAFEAEWAPDYAGLATEPRRPPAKGDHRYSTSVGDYYGVIAMYESEAATWDQAAKELLIKAGESYASAGNGFSGQHAEKEARFLRALAKEFAPIAADVRTRLTEYRATYRPDVRVED